MSALRGWIRFWFEPQTPVNLGISRALFFAGLLVFYARDDFSLWATVSPAAWMPLPLFSWLHLKPLSAPALDVLQFVWRIALFMSAIGLWSRVSMTAAALLGVYLLGLPHNFGHTFHFDALLVIASIVLALSRAGDAWSVDAALTRRAQLRSGEYTWPIRLVWVAMSLVFLAAGLAKLRHGGLAWVFSDNMVILLRRAAYHVSDADPISGLGLWIADHAWLARTLAGLSLVIELGFVASLFSRAARMMLVPAAVAMLVGIRVLMGPTFGGFLIANVFWVPWDLVSERAAAWLRRRSDLPTSSSRTSAIKTAGLLLILVWRATPASADIAGITGYVELTAPSASNGPVVLVGERGFTFQSSVTSTGNVIGPSASCNPKCDPGSTLSLNINASGGDFEGTATLDGVTYFNVGSASAHTSMLFLIRGSVVLPPISPTAAITAPFALVGSSFAREDGSDALIGAGTATVWLSASQIFPGSWHVDRALYRFDSPLPDRWTSADIGQVGREGTASFANGAFTVSGAGADIWNSVDSFHYLFQALSDGTGIVARVNGEQNTSGFAKAGVMLRGSLAPEAARIVLDVKPDGGVEFMVRQEDSAETTFIAGTAVTFPVWLKLAISGANVEGAVSNDGTTWESLGTTSLPAGFDNIGLAVTSHDVEQLNQVVFDQVVITATLSSAPPPAQGDGSLVIYASDISAAARHGAWKTASDSSSPGRVKLVAPNKGFTNTDAPLAAPHDYIDVVFDAAAGVRYTLWLRMQATDDSKFNDSVWVQFSDALSDGGQVFPLNSTSGLLVNLATDSSGASLGAWGWQDTAYWLSQTTTFTFQSSGPHTMRIQTREGGVQIDQIVLSPATYLNTPPGPPTHDTTIVAKLTGPFHGAPAALPGGLQAEDFDVGGEAVAYHDNTSGNAGGAYRPAEDVDIVDATGNATGYVINNFEAGEWLDYTVSVATAGTYSLVLKASSQYDFATFRLEIDGASGGSGMLANTGSWGAFAPSSPVSIFLAQGTHLLRLFCVTPYFNLDEIQIF